jgi:hypothetical protein
MACRCRPGNLFPIEAYLGGGYGFGVDRGRCMPVLATRGCPYQCYVLLEPADVDHALGGARAGRRAGRDPRRTWSATARRNFDFYDLTAIIRRDWIVAFCRLVLASGLRFTWQLRRAPARRRSTRRSPSCCTPPAAANITYAPESGSPSELRRIKKKVKLDSMKRSMRACTRPGHLREGQHRLRIPGPGRDESSGTSMRFIVSMAAIGVRDTMVLPLLSVPGVGDVS